MSYFLSNWRFAIAFISLMLAISVYLFARIYPPEIFIPMQALNTDFAALTCIFGSAPSFFYTLAVGLFIGLLASNQANTKLHCLMWVGLCLLLELTQIQTLSRAISNWLSGVLHESAWGLIGPYWQRGVFDPIDLLATLVGGLIALLLIARLPTEERHAAS